MVPQTRYEILHLTRQWYLKQGTKSYTSPDNGTSNKGYLSVGFVTSRNPTVNGEDFTKPYSQWWGDHWHWSPHQTMVLFRTSNICHLTGQWSCLRYETLSFSLTCPSQKMVLCQGKSPYVSVMSRKKPLLTSPMNHKRQWCYVNDKTVVHKTVVNMSGERKWNRWMESKSAKWK
jgi:hypothetical protein